MAKKRSFLTKTVAASSFAGRGEENVWRKKISAPPYRDASVVAFRRVADAFQSEAVIFFVVFGRQGKIPAEGKFRRAVVFDVDGDQVAFSEDFEENAALFLFHRLFVFDRIAQRIPEQGGKIARVQKRECFAVGDSCPQKTGFDLKNSASADF